MRCSGCGKDIPFDGKVCPHCQRDKSGDQTAHVLMVIVIVACAGVGYLVNGFVGALVGAVIGAIGGGILGGVVAASQKSAPPEVRISSDTTAVTPTSRSGVASRLVELDSLRAQGLITQDEWEEKRSAILREL